MEMGSFPNPPAKIDYLSDTTKHFPDYFRFMCKIVGNEDSSFLSFPCMNNAARSIVPAAFH